MDNMQNDNVLTLKNYNTGCLVDISYLHVRPNGSTNDLFSKGLKSLEKPQSDKIVDVVNFIYEVYEIKYINEKYISYPLIGRSSPYNIGNLRMSAEVTDYFWKKTRPQLVKLHLHTDLSEYKRVSLNMSLSLLKIFKIYPAVLMHRSFRHEASYPWLRTIFRKWFNTEGIPVFLNRSRTKIKSWSMQTATILQRRFLKLDLMEKYKNWYNLILFKKIVKVDVNKHFLATLVPQLVWKAPNIEKTSKWMYMSYVENVMWSSAPKTMFDRNIFWPFNIARWAGKAKRIYYLTPLGSYQCNSLIYNYKRLNSQKTVIMSARQHKKKVLSNVVRLIPKTKDNEKIKLEGLLRQHRSLKAWLRKKTPPLNLKLARSERRVLAYTNNKKYLAISFTIIKG